MKKIIITIVIFLFSLGGYFVYNEFLANKINFYFANKKIEKANFCETSSDCVLVGTKCPFGCYIYVNKSKKEEISSLINNFKTQCIYDCVENTGVECIKNKCKSITNKTSKNNTKQKQEQKEYDISKMKIGDSIEGLKLTEKSNEAINKRPAMTFTFTGEQEIKGVLSGYFDEMYEQNNFVFKSDIQKTLKIPFTKNTDTVKLFDTTIMNTDSLDANIKEKLINGEKIPVKLTIIKYAYVGFEDGERFADITMKNIEMGDFETSSGGQNEDSKGQIEEQNLVLQAEGFEPSWTISIDGNTLTYSSPELFSDENKTGRLDFHLNVLEKEGKNIVFEGEYISGKFIKKDCVTEGVGDTVPYTVEFTYKGKSFSNGCGTKIEEEEGKNTDEIIKKIRENYKEINNNISDFSQKKYEFSPEKSTEGGEITVFKSGNILKKIIVTYYGETFKKIDEYYFGDDTLFVFTQDKSYNMNALMIEGKVKYDNIEENRYYFYNDTLIKWLDADKKEVEKSNFPEKQQEIIGNLDEALGEITK